MKEGQGMIPPAPVPITLDDVEIRTAFEIARQRTAYRNYQGRSDQWGKGQLPAIDIPGVGSVDQYAAPAAVGLIGEFAATNVINRRTGSLACRVDTKLRSGGDGGIDLSPFGYGIDVKTRTKHHGGANLIRRRRENGDLVRWKCNAFVFAEWQPPFKEVLVLGWIPAADAAKFPESLARGGFSHWNIEIPDYCLRPISRLTELLRSIQALCGQ